MEKKVKKIKRNTLTIINNKSKYLYYSKNMLFLNKIKLTANFVNRIKDINK